jgi:hypothetical protein
MFGRKKETSVIVLHVNTSQLPSSKAKELMEETIAGVRESLSLKPSAKVIALACKDCDSYIETLYIDSNLIGE